MSTVHRSANFGGDADQSGDAGWRVILVGRTGMDQVLRRDPGFELVRARDALDAVGELSDPIDESSPIRSAVVVAPDAEPGGVELGRFLGALRRVEPSVVIIRAGEPRPEYDAFVVGETDAPSFRAVLESCEPSPDDQPFRFHEPEHPSRPVDVPLDSPDQSPDQSPSDEHADERCGSHSSAGDVDDPHRSAIASVSGVASQPIVPGDDALLVRALLGGRPIAESALELARRRAGRDDLHIDPATGRITCDDADWALDEGAAVLASLSAWMSAWTRLEAQHRDLRHAAFTDPLTGAWNRRYFDRFMDAAIEQARGARRTLTLMVFDIDNFKRYNDAYGHAAGDEILVETVRLLTSVIRPTDRVCRVGGDEFAVIFYEPQGPRSPESAPPESVSDIAKRFQKQICNHRFPKLGEEAAGTLTISGGLATFPWDGHNPAALLERADQLAIESKRQGKNALTFGQGTDRANRPSQ